MKKKNLGGGGVVLLLIALIAVKAYADPQAVRVQNQATQTVAGTLNCPDGGHAFSVDPGHSIQYSVGPPLSVTINGQTLMAWQNGTVSMPDNSHISVAWQQDPATGVIVIITSTVDT
jgi:hypothetical protein